MPELLNRINMQRGVCETLFHQTCVKSKKIYLHNLSIMHRDFLFHMDQMKLCLYPDNMHLMILI